MSTPKTQSFESVYYGIILIIKFRPLNGEGTRIEPEEKEKKTQ